MDEIDLLLGINVEEASPPATVPTRTPAKRLFGANAQPAAPPKRVPIEKVVVKQSGKVADLSRIAPRKVHVIETTYADSPNFSQSHEEAQSDSEEATIAESPRSFGQSTTPNRPSRCGRKAAINSVVVSADLNHHQLVPLGRLRPDQVVPCGFVGSEIPLCKHYGKVTLGKINAY